MNDDLGRQNSKALLQNVNIRVKLQHLYASVRIFPRQIGSAQDMQQMQFHTVHRELPQMARGLHDHLRRLTGKAEDLVRDDLNIQRVKLLYRVVKDR